MADVEELERAIAQLSNEDLSALRRWFLDFDAKNWDAQLERDVASGRLDSLAEEALADLENGRTRRL